MTLPRGPGVPVQPRAPRNGLLDKLRALLLQRRGPSQEQVARAFQPSTFNPGDDRNLRTMDIAGLLAQKVWKWTAWRTPACSPSDTEPFVCEASVTSNLQCEICDLERRVGAASPSHQADSPRLHGRQ